ncbi:hypothetical protein [Plastoroseomonas arctica]|uniref:Uncharacterized protein n=1 Tax=Plastoroseomonas arctica TaxID=1509237 RepID=A0AAF1KM77_9PROT|nr:hypothetical protein [Plastoroseomonas arctica]MBR0655946.1 hypothetical protein [Plastoroseomonas arctica]
MKAAIDLEQPQLSSTEAALLEHLLAESRDGYLEFGLGGSTLKAVRSATPRIVAVDSDAGWVAGVSQHAEIAAGLEAGRVHIVHAAIGPLSGWGRPADRSQIHHWPRYVALPWAACREQGFRPDLIFIDGRFRVACAISAAIMGLGDAEWRGKVRLVLHDYVGRQHKYRTILDFCAIEQAEDSMIVLSLRPDIDANHAMTSLLTYVFNWG